MRLCYRCPDPVPAVVDHAGYAYCAMCFRVVVAMQGAVAHDPPVGFPGGRPGLVDYAERTLDMLEEGGR